MVYRKRRRQAGWGRRRRTRQRQRGRGPRWDSFKAGVKNVANRAWNKIAPNLVTAGRAAIPRAAKVMLNPFKRNKEAELKNVAINFGKDLANSFIPGTFGAPKRPRRRRPFITRTKRY